MLGGSAMAYRMGEAKPGPLRVDFDRRPKLEFHGSKVTSDAGFPAYRERDHALGPAGMAGSILTAATRGKNFRHLFAFPGFLETGAQLEATPYGADDGGRNQEFVDGRAGQIESRSQDRIRWLNDLARRE